MKAFWSDTRANGQPIDPGTFCRVIDLEDGSHPIHVYGKTQEEVFEKIERQNMNAQIAINSRRAPATTPAPARVIGPSEIMQATADLANPAKSASAVATLVEHATGVNPVELARQNYARLAMEWEQETAEFYAHAGNRQLMGNRAILLAGGKPGAVTREILNAAYEQLKAERMLFERPADPLQSDDPPPSSTFPVETPVQRVERPRGTQFSTGTRSTSFRAAQTAQTRALKYTEEEIRTMPERKRLQVFNDADYIAACDHYFGAGAKTA